VTLSEQGYRYLVSPDKEIADWIHPAEVGKPEYEGWFDCTDTPDDEFDRFMADKPTADA
jgi:hypothetical protein